MPEPPAGGGLIDTSVVIELGRIDPAVLPSKMAISTITLAELAAGSHATDLPVYTANPADFAGLDDLITVTAIRTTHSGTSL